VNSSKKDDDPTKVKKEDITWEYITSIVMINQDSDILHTIDNNNPITGGDKNLNDNTISDSNKVFQYICIFEVFIASYIFSYIWFYVTFYSFSNNIQNVTFFDHITHDNFSSSENPFGQALFFVIEYSLIILDVFRWAIIEQLPQTCKYLQLNNIFCFLLLFMIIFFVNYKCITFVKNLLIDLLKFNYKNIFVILIMIYVAGKYLMSYSITPNKSEKDFDVTEPMLEYLNLATKYTEMARMGPFAVFYMMLLAFKEIIRIMTIFFVGIPFGLFLSVIYFLWISIGLNVYSVFDTNIRKHIIQFLRDGLADIENPTTCKIERTFWEQVWDGVRNIFLYSSLTIFNFLPFLLLIMFLFYVIIDHVLNIKENNVATIIQISSALLLFVLCIQMFITVLNYGYSIETDDIMVKIYGICVLPPFQLLFDYLNGSYITMIIIFMIIILLSVSVSISSIFFSENKVKDTILNNIYLATKYIQDIPEITNKNV